MIRRRFVLSLIGCVLVGAVAVSGQTKLPRVEFRELTLANGLHVLSVVDKSSPSVAINVWYHVGSKDDPEQRSGFAHLFEHIMFKSTKNMKSEMMDRLTEDVGGSKTRSHRMMLQSITKLFPRTISRRFCGPRPSAFPG